MRHSARHVSNMPSTWSEPIKQARTSAGRDEPRRKRASETGRVGGRYGQLAVKVAVGGGDIAGGDAGAVPGTALAIKLAAHISVRPIAGGFAGRVLRRALPVAMDVILAGAAVCLLDLPGAPPDKNNCPQIVGTARTKHVHNPYEMPGTVSLVKYPGCVVYRR